MTESKMLPKLCKALLLLCVVLPAALTQEAAGPPGKTVNPTKASSTFYFLSQNAASWSTALSDCEANLGEGASLLSIETKEELENVIKFLRDSDDTGSSYWTSGKYVPAKDAFEWENGVPFGSWAPWDEGQPSSKLPVTRVYIYTAGDVKFRTDMLTTSMRYVCELSVSN